MSTARQVKTRAFMVKVSDELHEAAIAYSKREQIPIAVLLREMLKAKLGWGDGRPEPRGVEK